MKHKNLLWIIGLLFLISLTSVNAKVSFYDSITTAYHFNSDKPRWDVINNNNLTGSILRASPDKNGVSNNALELSNYHLNSSFVSGFNLTNPHSISFWVKKNVADDNKGLFAKTNMASDTEFQYTIWNSFTKFGEANAQETFVNISQGSYDHIVYTRLSNGTAYFYKNNVLVNQSYSASAIVSSTKRFVIGCYYTTSYCVTNTTIDELIFINQSLTSSQVSELYNSYDTWDIITTDNISFISPTPSDDSFVANNFSISTNTTFNTSSNTTHYLYNSSNSLIYNITSSDNPFTSIITNLSNGRYFYNATSTNGSLIIKTDTRMISFFNANVSSTSTSCIINLGLAYFRPNNCGDI